MVAIIGLVDKRPAETLGVKNAPSEGERLNQGRMGPIVRIAVIIANDLMKPSPAYSDVQVHRVEDAPVDPMDTPADESITVKQDKGLRSEDVSRFPFFAIDTHMKSRQPST